MEPPFGAARGVKTGVGRGVLGSKMASNRFLEVWTPYAMPEIHQNKAIGARERGRDGKLYPSAIPKRSEGRF